MERGQLIFNTSTALYWKHLFANDIYKDIIVDSLKFMSYKKWIVVYGLVIMLNHIHLLIEVPIEVPVEKDIQHSFMSFTAHEIKKMMKAREPKINQISLKVNRKTIRTFKFGI